MRNVTGRQRYLHLSAKLYELAAEFSDAELFAMLRDGSKGAGEKAIGHAIRALIQLHQTTGGDGAVSDVSRHADEARSEGRSPSQQGVSLATLFSDRDAFPSVSNIAEVVGLEVRPKEARDRYLARAIRHIESLSARERAELIGGLASRLDKQPDSFISKWSKVIKGA